MNGSGVFEKLMKPPIVEIETMSFEESEFVNPQGKAWSAPKLAAAAKGLPEFEIPLASINIGTMPFVCESLNHFMFHYMRIRQTNLTYPIILDTDGRIADGWHRVAKAIIQGQTTIKAVRLTEMPPYDRIEEE